MMRRAVSFPTMAAAAAVVMISASAQATVDTVIQGSVRDENLAPISAATVGLYDRRGKLIRQTTTTLEGTFSLALTS